MNKIVKVSFCLAFTLSMLLFSSYVFAQKKHLSIVAAPSGPDKSTTSNSWRQVPHLKTKIKTNEGDGAIITVSAEANTGSNNTRMFIRAIVDGKPAMPSDVMFVRGKYSGTRSFSFYTNKLKAGEHIVKIEWHVDGGGKIFIGDRTLTVLSFDENDDGIATSVNAAAAPSGKFKTSTTKDWRIFPDLLIGNQSTVPNGSIAVGISAETTQNSKKSLSNFSLRATASQNIFSPTGVAFSAANTVQSFTFVKKGLPPSGYPILAEWRSWGKSKVGDRTMTSISGTVSPYQGYSFNTASVDPPDFGTNDREPYASTSSGKWESLPKLSGPIVTFKGGKAMVTVSGDCRCGKNGRIFLRVKIGDEIAKPSDVLFCNKSSGERKSFIFIFEGLPEGYVPGWVNEGGASTKFAVEWTSSTPNKKVYMKDRSVMVLSVK